MRSTCTHKHNLSNLKQKSTIWSNIHQLNKNTVEAHLHRFAEESPRFLLRFQTSRSIHRFTNCSDIKRQQISSFEAFSDLYPTMESFYYLLFGAMSAIVAVIELSKTNRDRINTTTAFNSFKNNYLLVYSLMMGTFTGFFLFFRFRSEFLLFTVVRSRSTSSLFSLCFFFLSHRAYLCLCIWCLLWIWYNFLRFSDCYFGEWIVYVILLKSVLVWFVIDF